ncbi:MAG: extracellular solute-binding protein [Clostridiales bacterium]|nr:extracellular solute-binding protein [Clostridiales bacterium]
MKTMKTALFTLVLVLLLTASALAETNITLWHSMSEEAGALMDEFVQEFNETVGKEAGIHVESVFQGKYSDATTKMNSILAAGQYDTLPDVMQIDATGKVAYAAAETAYTVDDALADHPEADLSMMLAPALMNWNLSGRQLGLPFATSTTLLYYNKSLLDAAGAAAPGTLSDIGALAGVLPETNADGQKLTVYASLPNTPTLANWLGQLGSDLVDGHNGTEETATRLACIENGALLAFLQEWKALYASGALDNSAGSTDAFVAGQQAIMTSSSSNTASLLSKIGGRFELGAAYYPKVNADASAGATVSGSCLVMFGTDEARRQAAWTFVTWLTGADVQARLAAGTGYLPSNMQAAESSAWQTLILEYPQYDVGLRQLMETPDSMRSVTVGPSADFYYAIQNDVSDMLEEDLSPEETAELMEEDLNGLLEQYLRANP